MVKCPPNTTMRKAYKYINVHGTAVSVKATCIAKRTPAKKVAKKTPAKKSAPKKIPIKKTPAKKVTKKTPAKKVKKTPVKKTPTKRSTKKSKSPPKKRPTFKKSPPKKYTGRDYSCITKSKLPLKSHQKILVANLLKQRGILAIHAVGSGKTLTAVTASQCFLSEHPKGKVIIVTPTSLQSNFKKEMKQYDPTIDDENYEFYTFEGFSRANNRGEIQCKNSMLIIDEAHNLRTEVKGSKGQRVQNLLKCSLLSNAQKILLLTATPIVNKQYDMVNLISFIDGKKPMTEKKFDEMLENDAAFNEYFRCKISIFEPDTKETAEFYPKSKIHEVFIPMPKKYEKRYLDIEMNADPKGTFKNPSVFYNGVRRASNKLDDSLTAPKVEWLKDFLDEHKTGKMVIFSHWLDSGLAVVMDVLEKKKIPFLHIDGSLSQKKRTEAVKQYNDDEIRILLISKAGGEGLDLKETRYMVLMDPGWNPATADQVIGRGIRFKSHYNLPKKDQIVDIYKLFLVKSDEAKHVSQYVDVKEAKEDAANGEKWSVDLYLRAIAIEKKNMIDDMINRLLPLSIEESNCHGASSAFKTARR